MWTFSFQGKICVSASRLWNVHCLNLVFLPSKGRSSSKKNYISGYIWPTGRSFIRAVKCSLLEEKNVYQSFYGASLTLYFLLQGKVLCFARVGKSLAKYFLAKGFPRPCRKNCVSGYIWHNLFIRTVKCSSFNQITVYQSFYGAQLNPCLVIFYFQELV